MKVLAVTCYTGGDDLVEMTESMFYQLDDCDEGDAELVTCALGQGASREIVYPVDLSMTQEENRSFAHGMNMAIEFGSRLGEKPDWVLVLNNDLEFPRKNWLQELLRNARSDRIAVPATDVTALHPFPEPQDRNPFDVTEMSAYCWVVPWHWCRYLKKHYGFWLFDEDFVPGYGDDNWTAFLLSKHFGKKIFRVVPRSWIKHLKARTSKQVPHDRRKTNQVLIDKLQGELKDPRLRQDLKLWARRYIQILSKTK